MTGHELAFFLVCSRSHDISYPPAWIPDYTQPFQLTNDSEACFTLYPPHSNTSGQRHTRFTKRFSSYSGMSSGSLQLGAREAFSYTLVCDGEVLHCDSDEIEPFKPRVLPIFPPSSPTPSTQWKTTKQNRGCGVIASRDTVTCMLLQPQRRNAVLKKGLRMRQ